MGVKVNGYYGKDSQVHSFETAFDNVQAAVDAIIASDATLANQEAIIADTEDIQTILGTPANFMANLTTLETRLSATRAGYLDQLDFALQEAIAAIPTTMVGTNNAALASVLGALNDVAASGAVTDIDTVMQYVKQLVTLLLLVPTTAMRGTDNVVLAGPTKVEMDSGHALLATPAQVASELATYDSPTRAEATSDMNTLIAMIAAFGG